MEELAIPPERQDEILGYLGLNPNEVATQALVQICNRYGFDPLLKHVVLIGSKGSKNTYVTRDGLLHLAHKSQQLDGLAVLEEWDDETEWCAVVEVYRKDMSHPFRYRGRYSKHGQNKQYGPEMAVKCAEVMALRRAFDVALPTIEEQWDTHSTQVGDPVVLQEHQVPEDDLDENLDILDDQDAHNAGVTKAKDSVRSLIKSRLNSDAALGRRDEFRQRYGHPDTLPDDLVNDAWEWVKTVTDQSMEPF